jgi:hypothetical protein
MVRTKPHGIFDVIYNHVIRVDDVRNSLERLLEHIDAGRQGHKDGVWSWDEVVNSIWCYVAIMKSELDNQEAAKGGRCGGNTQTIDSNTIHCLDKPPRKSPSEDEKCIQCKKEDRIMYQWCKGDDKERYILCIMKKNIEKQESKARLLTRLI